MGKVIALVNDDEAYLQLLSEVLAGEGYGATCHADGTAWLTLRRARPDLILLDFRPHWRDETWALLEGLRGDPTLAMVPVIASSTDHAFLRARAAQLQACRCATIARPFDLDDLLGLIATALKQADATENESS